MANNYFQATIRNLCNRLRAMKDQSALTYAIMKGIQENEQFILDIVRWDQLDNGVNGYDIEIAEYAPYAFSTKLKKLEKRQPTEKVTLRDTGHFYNKMRVVVTTKGFYIESPIAYAPDLVEKYGKEIFRITDYNFNRLVVPLIRIFAFDYIVTALKGYNEDAAIKLAFKLKRRLKADYKSLVQYTSFDEWLSIDKGTYYF